MSYVKFCQYELQYLLTKALVLLFFSFQTVKLLLYLCGVTSNYLNNYSNLQILINANIPKCFLSCELLSFSCELRIIWIIKGFDCGFNDAKILASVTGSEN